jgi:tight adherence protein B
MDLMLLLIGVCIAGSVALAASYSYERVMVPRRTISARLAPAPTNAGVALRSGLRTTSRSRLPFVDKLPISPEARERMRIELQRAGDPLSVNEYQGLQTALALGLGFVGAVIMSLVDGMPVLLGLGLTVGLMLVGWRLPRTYVTRAKSRRQDEIADQLPATLTAITKSLRAGTGLLQALAYAANETPGPLGAELGHALRDLQLGADPAVTFIALSERVGNADLDIAVTAILIQRNVGGNLSEILNNVTKTIRERAKIQAEIRLLTSRQRLQANIVAALPVVVALSFILINPELGTLLYETPVGRIALAVGVGFELLGLWLIRRLSVIEY